jgi:maltose/moltooligosaccharide transporter
MIDNNPGQIPPVGDKVPVAKISYAGTLSYTKPALAILFFWLFWGDFCYTVMEAVTVPIMQLKFAKLDASNTEIGLILGVIPGTLYAILNPIISFKSDRFRSRWGRRIPFIVFSLPFLVTLLVCLAYGEKIGVWLHGHLGFLLAGISANQVSILSLGLLFIVYNFFNSFVTSTFWYLFNDVVPEYLVARFMAWFRTIGLFSTSFYSFLILPYSGTHSTEIFLSAAVLYAVGFGLMCRNVREGEYPPPAPYIDGRTDTMAAVTTFTRETHAFPHYWYLWLCTFIGQIGGTASVIGAGNSNLIFAMFFSLAIGLNIHEIAFIYGFYNITTCVLTPVAGWLADKFHPIRVVYAGVLINLVVGPMNLIWLFWHPSNNVVFWVTLAINVLVAAPGQAFGGMWDPPMLMRLFPRSNYGQFCSTNAVWRTAGGILGSALVGIFLDSIKGLVGKEQAYYYLPIWAFLFGLPSFFLFVQLYLSWKRHGGDEAYIAPVLLSIPTPNSPLTPVGPAV